jgi:hypothetical protein
MVGAFYLKRRGFARGETKRIDQNNSLLMRNNLSGYGASSEADHIPGSELVRRASDAYLAWNDPTYSQPPMRQTRKANSSPA